MLKDGDLIAMRYRGKMVWTATRPYYGNLAVCIKRQEYDSTAVKAGELRLNAIIKNQVPDFEAN